MFAVPGWALSAASLVQENPSFSRSSDQPSFGSSAPATKKRKHPQSHTDRVSKLSGSELERLWNQHNALNQAGPVAKSTKKHRSKAEVQPGSKATQRDSHADKREKKGGRREDALRLDNQNERSLAAKSDKSSAAANGEHIASASMIEEGTVKGKKHKNETEEKDKKDKRRKNNRTGKENGENQTDQTAQHLANHSDSSQPSSKKVLASLPPPVNSVAKLTPLQAKMRNKLTSARFRHLNEALYTTTSSSALNLFTTSPDLFAEYHAGFSQQVKDSWPQNPVDQYVANVKTRGALTSPSSHKIDRNAVIPLPRRKTGSCTIADLGCGDAPLARGCQSAIKALKLKFHNFDLHSPNSLVTKADISNLPLRDGEADIAVFCLSLMGTNWVTFVEEAWRILRGDGKGEVWVAEVKSRFGRVSRGGEPRVVENSVGKRRKNQKPKNLKSATASDDEDDALLAEDLTAPDGQPKDSTDISAFVRVFTRRGFQLREESVDKTNKMFVSMVFIKTGIPTAGKHKGLKWNGREYQRIQQDGGGKRFAGGQASGKGDADEISVEEEAKVLKPCVYKTR